MRRVRGRTSWLVEGKEKSSQGTRTVGRDGPVREANQKQKGGQPRTMTYTPTRPAASALLELATGPLPIG